MSAFDELKSAIKDALTSGLEMKDITTAVEEASEELADAEDDGGQEEQSEEDDNPTDQPEGEEDIDDTKEEG